eukprot:gene5884-6125_t
MARARAAAERRRDLLARQAAAYWQFMIPSLLMLMFVVGRERYILLRGQITWIVKVFFGTGLGLRVTGRCCGWCPIVWQHRLLIINVANLFSAVPLFWHLFGSISAWLVAIVVDAAAPAAMCGLSLACLVNAVVDLIQAASKLGMRALLWQALAGLLSSSSLIHLAECLVPGSVAIWLEVRFYRTSLQQQRQQQREHLQAEPESGPTAQGAASTTAAAANKIPQALTALQATDPSTFGSSAASRLQQAGQQSTAGRPIRYRSPVVTRMVTLKLQHPADAAPEDFANIQHQLAVAVQAHLNFRQTSARHQLSSSKTNLFKWQIIRCISFKGCWHIIMHAIYPRWPLAAEAEDAAVADIRQQQQQGQLQGYRQDSGSAPAEGDDHQLHQLDLQAVVQEVLQELPGWSISDARLLQPRTLSELLGAEQLQSPEHAGTIVTADEPSSSYPQLPSSVSAAGSAAASASPGDDPSARHALFQPGLSLCPATVSRSPGDPCGKVNLAVDSATARQLQQAGVADLRLVVTHQPQSRVLMDQVFELPHQADTACDADLACDLHFDLGHISCCAVQLELEELLESVVSLGTARTAAYQQLLPLLQDWATLMLMKGDDEPEDGGWEAGKLSGSGIVENEQQYACKAIFNAIAAVFDDFDLTHCYELLMQQHWQHSRHQLQPVALLREDLNETSGAAGEGAVQAQAAATAGAGEQPGLRRRPAGSVAAGSAAGGEGSSASAAVSRTKAMAAKHDHQDCPTKAWAGGSSSKGLVLPDAGARHPRGQAAVTWQSLLAGSVPGASNSERYMLFKASKLFWQDLFVTSCFSLLMVVKVISGLWLLGDPGSDQKQILQLCAAVKAYILLLLVLAHGALALAFRCSVLNQQQGRGAGVSMRWMATLVHHRGWLLSSMVGLQLVSFHYLLWREGTLRTVGADLLMHYQTNCLMYFGFNHVFQPVVFSNGLLAAAAHACLVIGLAHLPWTPPALLGWSVLQRTALYCCCFLAHMGLSFHLEYGMQRKFLMLQESQGRDSIRN